MSTASLIIFIVAILIALAIAWHEFDVKEDLDRLRRRLSRDS